MTKLASLTGYTVGSASVTFGKIKQKIKHLGEGLAADGPATPKRGGGPGRSKATPKSTGKRAAFKSAGDDNGSESPTKRSKKTAGAAKKKRNNGDDDDDDDDDEMFAPRVKKEELTDITAGAMSFYDQLENAAAGDDA